MKLTINSLKVFTKGNKKNHPIIFIHGFPFDHSMWNYQVDALKNEFYCVTYDIRGLGESYIGDGQYTMEAFVWDLFSIIDELKLNKPTLCGLSMGGYIALRAVTKEQERFGSLILCDTKSQADDNAGKLKRSNDINQINIEGIETFVNEFVPKCFHPKIKKHNNEMYEKVLSKCKKQNPLGVKGAIFAMLSRLDTTKTLGTISIPALILVGKKDILTPPQLMKQLAEKISNAHYKTVPKAGHLSPLENPEYVNKKILKFLKEI